MTRRVVITGLGAVTPLGFGAKCLHKSAIDGLSGIRNGLGRITNFDGATILGKREGYRLDRFSQFALVAAHEALDQAGWTKALPASPFRIPCYIGSAIGGLITLEEQVGILGADGAEGVSPLTVPKLMANAAAAHISMRFGLRGESAALVAACSGGAQAIVSGIRAIRLGEADAAVVGGAEASVTRFTTAIFAAAGALSPSGRSVPFSADRDGFILGEGAGILVLEEGEVARSRGAQILGEIAGYGLTSDAHHITAPDPAGTAATEAIRVALADSRLTSKNIDYINAHGTGTLLNDAIEVQVLRAAFGSALASIPISSSKSYLGHLLGAAGAVEAVATVQALRHRQVPPNVGLAEVDPRLGPLMVPAATMSMPNTNSRCIGISNSMGFGGHNVTLVFGV